MEAASDPTSSSSAVPIDGKNLAFQVRRTVARRVAEGKRRVRLDAVLVGEDKGADIYAHNQRKTCAAVGIEYHLHRLPASASIEAVEAQVRSLNEDDDVTAIMVHLPLPDGVEAERVQSLIDEIKDVEGVNPANIGNIVYGRRSLVPCTALASVEMIESTGIELRGKRCVIVGASNIVGKPIAVLLMRAEATVISTNKYTEDLGSLTRTADVLVSAAGVAGLITRDMVKPGAVVVDVGINRVLGANGKRRTVGDVAFEEVAEVAGHLSPVPGGVGPMTVAMLLRNTVEAAGV
ncbi:MAG: bifunctional 5,10-methylenetetrahydrofolate dehydrogenase/5,10-methenyltetrahydrofolate cyclohydrolase [Phycisphaerales bacterium]